MANKFSIHYDELFVVVTDPDGSRKIVKCGRDVDHCFQVVSNESKLADKWTMFHLFGIRDGRSTVLARWGKGPRGRLVRHGR